MDLTAWPKLGIRFVVEPVWRKAPLAALNALEGFQVLRDGHLIAVRAAREFIHCRFLC